MSLNRRTKTIVTQRRCRARGRRDRVANLCRSRAWTYCCRKLSSRDLARDYSGHEYGVFISLPWRNDNSDLSHSDDAR